MALSAVASSGCGIVPHVVSKGAAGYLDAGALVFQQEPDPQIAREAIPANFKLLEILLSRTPRDKTLLTLGAQYIATYAYAFVEPDVEMLEPTDPAGADAARVRASQLYLRGKAYGLRALAGEKRFIQGLSGTPEELQAGLKTLGKKQLPALFWTSFCWGSHANLNVDDPEALAESAKVVAMMGRVMEIDDTYYYGGAHLFFGALAARLPMEAGGDAKKSLQEFEKALAISQGHLLMTKVFFARYYAVRVQDAALFTSLLREVNTADITAWPDERLANALAQERARFYLQHRDEYFLSADVP